LIVCTINIYVDISRRQLQLVTQKMIYIKEVNPNNDITLIIEEDIYSIWAYLLNDTSEIIQDGFICSTGHLVNSQEEIKNAIDNGLAPPLLKNFANEHSIQTNLNENDIEFEWQSKDEITVKIYGTKYLRMNIGTNESFCFAINRDGPYGKKMN